MISQVGRLWRPSPSPFTPPSASANTKELWYNQSRLTKPIRSCIDNTQASHPNRKDKKYNTMKDEAKDRNHLGVASPCSHHQVGSQPTSGKRTSLSPSQSEPPLASPSSTTAGGPSQPSTSQASPELQIQKRRRTSKTYSDALQHLIWQVMQDRGEEFCNEYVAKWLSNRARQKDLAYQVTIPPRVHRHIPDHLKPSGPNPLDVSADVSPESAKNILFGTVVGVRRDLTITLTTDPSEKDFCRVGVVPDKPYMVAGDPPSSDHKLSRVAVMGTVKVNLGPNHSNVTDDGIRNKYVFASGENDGYACLRDDDDDAVRDFSLFIGEALRVVKDNERPDGCHPNDVYVETWVPDHCMALLVGRDRTDKVIKLLKDSNSLDEGRLRWLYIADVIWDLAHAFDARMDNAIAKVWKNIVVDEQTGLNAEDLGLQIPVTPWVCVQKCQKQVSGIMRHILTQPKYWKQALEARGHGEAEIQELINCFIGVLVFAQVNSTARVVNFTWKDRPPTYWHVADAESLFGRFEDKLDGSRSDKVRLGAIAVMCVQLWLCAQKCGPSQTPVFSKFDFELYCARANKFVTVNKDDVAKIQDAITGESISAKFSKTSEVEVFELDAEELAKAVEDLLHPKNPLFSTEERKPLVKFGIKKMAELAADIVFTTLCGAELNQQTLNYRRLVPKLVGEIRTTFPTLENHRAVGDKHSNIIVRHSHDEDVLDLSRGIQAFKFRYQYELDKPWDIDSAKHIDVTATKYFLSDLNHDPEVKNALEHVTIHRNTHCHSSALQTSQEDVKVKLSELDLLCQEIESVLGAESDLGEVRKKIEEGLKMEDGAMSEWKVGSSEHVGELVRSAFRDVFENSDPFKNSDDMKALLSATAFTVSKKGITEKVEQGTAQVKECAASQKVPARPSSKRTNTHKIGRRPKTALVQRQTLRAIEDVFQNNDICALYGAKGVGKSNIAQQFVDANEEKYDVIWWVDCSTKDDVASGLWELCQQFPQISNQLLSKGVMHRFDEEKERRGNVKRGSKTDNDLSRSDTLKVAMSLLWQELRSMSVLCVFDDFTASMDGIPEVTTKEWMEQYLPKSQLGAHLLFTANSEKAAEELCRRTSAKPINISGLETPECAIELLKSTVGCAPVSMDESEWDRKCQTLAVEQLRCHPQGIYVAGKALSKKKKGARDDVFEKGNLLPSDPKKNATRRTSEQVGFRDEILLAYKMALNIIGLNVNDKGEIELENTEVEDDVELKDVQLARELLLRLCFIDARSIARPIVEAMSLSIDASNDKKVTRGALQALVDVGLVVEMDDHTVWMHSLTTDILRTRSPKSDRSVLLSSAICGLSDLTSASLKQEGGRHAHLLCCTYRVGAHLLQFWHYMKRELEEMHADVIEKMCIMAGKLSSSVLNSSHLQQANDIIAIFGAICEHPTASMILRLKFRSIRSQLFVAMGRFSEGMRDLEMNLHLISCAATSDICDITRTGFHANNDEYTFTHDVHTDVSNENYAATLHAMGALEAKRGNLDGASDYYSQSFEMNKNIHGDVEAQSIAVLLHAMGELEEKRGNQDAASDYYSQSLEMNKKVSGDTADPDIAVTLHDIGDLEFRRGNLEGAFDYFSQSLEMKKKVYGDVNHSIALTLHRMGALEEKRENRKAAFDYYTQSLEMKREVYGDVANHSIAVTLHSMGELEDKRENLGAASDYFSQSLEMMKKVYGDVAIDQIPATLRTMGELEQKLGNADAASKYYSQSLEATKKVDGEVANDQIAATLYSMGELEDKRGKLDAAFDYYSRSLEMMKKVSGGLASHSIAVTLRSMGELEEKRGKLDAAFDYYSQSSETTKEVYGDVANDHIALTFHHMGALEVKRGNLDSASDYYSQSLEMRKRVYGETENDHSAATLHCVGELEVKRGNLDAASDYFSQSLEMNMKVYGDAGHPNIAVTLHSMGELESTRGNLDAAFDSYSQSLEMTKKVNGDVAIEQTAVLLHCMGDVDVKRGNTDAACDYYSQSLDISRKVYGDAGHHRIAVLLYCMGQQEEKRGNLGAAIRLYTECGPLLSDPHLRRGSKRRIQELKKAKCDVCDNVAVYPCPRCKRRQYCSEDCRKKDWKKHKATCKK